MSFPIRLGSRGSPLALRQCEMVIAALKHRQPHLGRNIEVVVIKTSGDQHLNSNFFSQAQPGFFVKEIEEALKRGEIDGAVHSLKDLPSSESRGLCVAAFLPRERAHDLLCLSPQLDHQDASPTLLQALVAGDPRARFTVGTSSPRRRAALLARLPHCEVVPIRGNIETRLDKLAINAVGNGKLDAIVLAAAGLERLALQLPSSWLIPIPIMVPAAGQGMMAVQCRAGDQEMINLLSSIDCAASRQAAAAERSFMATLAAGCRSAVGVHAQPDGAGKLNLIAQVFSPNGEQLMQLERQAEVESAMALGRDAASELLASGAGALLV